MTNKTPATKITKTGPLPSSGSSGGRPPERRQPTLALEVEGAGASASAPPSPRRRSASVRISWRKPGQRPISRKTHRPKTPAPPPKYLRDDGAVIPDSFHAEHDPVTWAIEPGGYLVLACRLSTRRTPDDIAAAAIEGLRTLSKSKSGRGGGNITQTEQHRASMTTAIWLMLHEDLHLDPSRTPTQAAKIVNPDYIFLAFRARRLVDYFWDAEEPTPTSNLELARKREQARIRQAQWRGRDLADLVEFEELSFFEVGKSAADPRIDLGSDDHLDALDGTIPEAVVDSFAETLPPKLRTEWERMVAGQTNGRRDGAARERRSQVQKRLRAYLETA